MLAGVSVNYYTRLEQGESHQMSDAVVASLGSALHLDEGELQHLARLPRPAQFNRRDPEPEMLRESLRLMVEGNRDQVVGVVGRRMDLLGGNRLWNAMYGLQPGLRSNAVLRLFLDPAMRDFYPFWEEEARSSASYLRLATGELPDDPELASVIGELSIKSPEFVRIWAEHPVAECTNSVRVLDHPTVGRMTLNTESLRVPDGQGQRVIFMSAADPDTSDRLRLLTMTDPS